MVGEPDRENQHHHAKNNWGEPGSGTEPILSLQTAGTVIAFQSGLGYAQFFDPTQGGQSALISSFLSLLGLVMIFATNLHFIMLQAMADSYHTFPPAALPPLADFADTAVRFVAGSFRIGIQVAAPFIVYGIIYNVGIGTLQKLMPQVQVFLIGVPMQIGLSLLLLGATIGAAMTWFLTYYQDSVNLFAAH